MKGSLPNARDRAFDELDVMCSHTQGRSWKPTPLHRISCT
jgi:hypothetical protein